VLTRVCLPLSYSPKFARLDESLILVKMTVCLESQAKIIDGGGAQVLESCRQFGRKNTQCMSCTKCIL
jgi:hypothetical protein